jgi:hypothetical protein
MAGNWLAQGRAALLRNDPATRQAGAATMAAAGFGSVPEGTGLFTNRLDRDRPDRNGSGRESPSQTMLDRYRPDHGQGDTGLVDQAMPA